jgi:F-type H+-transporting ATPase subunit delta
VNTTAIARRYAKALFDLAAEDGEVDAVSLNLDLLAVAIRDVDADALRPGALGIELREQIGERLALTLGAESLLAGFLRVLARNDRLAELPAVSESFHSIQDAAEGRVRASITTATALSDAELDRVKAVFSQLVGKQVVPELMIDDSLLGGVVVEVEGRVFDGSLRTNLEHLSERMAGRSSRSTT